ncbi:uncharacterized mitochondrial protein-like protein [Tanacetum coccineum]
MDYIKLLELGMKPCQHICWTMGFKEGKLTRPYSLKGTKVIFCWSKFMWMISSLVQQRRSYAELKLMHENSDDSMGELTFFLGLQVQQKKDGIFISQDKYVGEILKKFRFTEVKTASTPMETQKPLLKDEDGEEVDVHMYSVCLYLKGQLKLGLWYPKDSPFDLVAYTDSDYAGASLDRKSTTGGCRFLICRLISWQCKKQKVVANSTTEAEYMAASSCCGQVLWIQNQLLDYGSKTTTWNKFSSTMASAIICLAINQKFNFSKYIFESMVKNLDNVGKFLMYPSVPSDNVTDEAVNEEMDDSLERAATTATSLDAEHDRGNINKTQSKATPNEPSSPGTSSGGGPRRQETMGILLLKLVLDLETTKTTQANEIASLKRRVKKLERRNKLRTHGLKRLYRVGSSRRVESSEDECLGEKDASKQGRIADIDADAGINLVSTHFDADTDMFEVHDLVGDEVVVESEVVVKAASTIPVSAATTTKTVITDNEITLAKALAKLRSAKLPTTTAATTITAVSTRPRAKGLVVHEEEQATTPIISSQQPSQLNVQDKAEEEEEEGLLDEKAKQSIERSNIAWTELMEESSKKTKAEITQESSSKRAGKELEQESSKKQKLEEYKESEELKQMLEIKPYEGRCHP